MNPIYLFFPSDLLPFSLEDILNSAEIMMSAQSLVWIPWALVPLTQQGGKHWGKEIFMENTVGVIRGDLDVIP